MKTAFQYIRKSNEDQSNFSISGQQMINEEWARKNNIQIIGTYIDDGYSAKDFNRPDWKRLEVDLPKSKVDFLIIMKYDRLIRNVIEGLTFVEKLEQKWNITLLSVMENYSIDIHDPYFFKHRADMFVDADFERRRISDRSRFGVWSAKSQGRFLGKAPYGYRNARDEGDKPIIVIDPTEAAHVKEVFDGFIAGDPYTVILARIWKKGFRLTGKDVLRRILSNNVYAGLIPVKAYKTDGKKTVTGIHEPIIPEGLFWQAFYKLQEQIKPVTLKLLDENLPLRGFLSCQNCNSPHTGAKCKGRSSYYYYYWCNKCRGKNYSSNKVHNDIMDMLKGLSLKQKHIDALKVLAEQELNETLKQRQGRLQKANKESAELSKQIEAVDKKYFEEKISDSTYQKWHSTYTENLNRIKIDVSRLENIDDRISKLYNENLDYLADLNWLYYKSPIEEKQSYLKGIFWGGLSTIPSGSSGSIWGYRTAYLNDLLSLNAPSIAHLLTVEKNGGASFLRSSPIGVGTGALHESFLRTVASVIKAA